MPLFHTRFLFIIALLATTATLHAKSPWTDPKDASLPADFMVQGEYAATGIGVQVIALDKGEFHAVVYPGGLPGAGWDGNSKSLMSGKTKGKVTQFVEAAGKRKYIAGPASQFSATKKFPPTGHKPFTATIQAGSLTLKNADGKSQILKRTIRISPTMGAKPPKNAIVLFDGSSKDQWQGGRLDEKTKLLNTDGRDIKTVKKFNNYIMHLEFMLPYKPEGRGQGRGNSGFYHVDHYEMQILDSYGLEGLNNECGGIYQKANSLVNMCLSPLQWQTYDVEFTNSVSKDGKKISNAILTAKLNGVVIHNKLSINGKTGGSRREPEGTPGPIKLQGHGNPLQFRNAWIIEK